MDDRRRARFEEQQADITNLQHTILTPLLQLIEACKFLLLLLAVGLWSLAVWPFGHLGGQGMWDRQAKADQIFLVREDGRDFSVPWNLETIDLSKRGGALLYRSGRLELPLDAYGSVVSGIIFVGAGPDLRGFSAAGVLSSQPLAIICVSGNDYDTSLGPWSTRSENALRRESARMQAAYDNGVIMASALRWMLTLMKLTGGHPDLSPHSAALFPGNASSLCNANPFQPGMSRKDYDLWVRTSQSIKLYAAPNVELMYYDHRIVGVTFAPYSPEDGVDGHNLTYYVTWLGDIVDSDPPLSEAQTRAVAALNRMSADEFWLQTAHWNDIHDDATILRLAAYARQYRDRIMFPKGKPDYIHFQ
jgi:hypothetical protein